jgi:hypothetical protein
MNLDRLFRDNAGDVPIRTSRGAALPRPASGFTSVVSSYCPDINASFSLCTSLDIAYATTLLPLAVNS